MYESITNFIFIEENLKRSDIIVIPGSKSLEPAIRAAELFNSGFAKILIPTGGENKLTRENESLAYLNCFLKSGINRENVILESKAKNTFENAKLTLNLVKENNLPHNNILLVLKGYHSRRALLTFKSVFPNYVKFNVAIVEKNIRRDNWMNNQKSIDLVMSEVSKIGQYFKSEILKDISNNK